MAECQPIVYVVDDDASVRKALRRLIRLAGLNVATFRSAAEFLRYERSPCLSCLLLDLRLPGMSGLDLQRHLAATDPGLPIIIMSGHGDRETRSRAMEAGAVAFLDKPFEDQDLLDSIARAIARHRS
jgi:FixJ family two-component response regulator